MTKDAQIVIIRRAELAKGILQHLATLGPKKHETRNGIVAKMRQILPPLENHNETGTKKSDPKPYSRYYDRLSSAFAALRNEGLGETPAKGQWRITEKGIHQAPLLTNADYLKLARKYNKKVQRQKNASRQKQRQTQTTVTQPPAPKTPSVSSGPCIRIVNADGSSVETTDPKLARDIAKKRGLI